MPDWLAWLLPVPLATLAAIAWTAWAGRTRGPAGASETVAEHERFRRALGEAVAPRDSSSSGRVGPADAREYRGR